MIKIPLTPQWGANSGCVSTPDGGLLYVGSKNITFIGPLKDGQPNIQTFYTRQPVRCIDIDPYWDNKLQSSSSIPNESSDAMSKNKNAEQQKLFAALFQDNSIQLFDINKDSAIQGHKAHLPAMRCMEGGSRPSSQHGSGEVYISFMCNSNILSIDNQDIVIYCIVSNLYYRRPMFISPRVHQITTLKCSPYNENHFAVGTRKGLVLLCDLQQMVTLYTLRSHDTTISSLAWNRIKLSCDLINAEQKEPAKPVPSKIETKNKTQTKLTRNTTIDTDEIFDIYDYDYLDNEFGAPSEGNKSKSELISDFVGIEKPNETMGTTTKFDFAEACQSLKEEINALRLEQPEISQDHIVTLEECQEVASQQQNESSSCGGSQDGNDNNFQEDIDENEPTSENISEAFLCRTVSSDDSVDIDGMDRTLYAQNDTSRIVCQAEIHATSSEEEKQPANEATTPTAKGQEQTACTTVKLAKSTDGKDDLSDILLASTSIDGAFCIWNAKTGASCDNHRIRGPQSEKSTVIKLCWLTPTSFTVLGKHGILHYWTLENNAKNNAIQQQQNGIRSYKFKEYKRKSPVQVANVVSFAVCQSQQLLWYISSKRDITLENLKTNEIELHYGSVSTNITALKECPDDMNKIAMGLSDRRIAIIDLSKMSPTRICIENFSQHIESAVMVLEWSPDSKKIVYGTIEGRIGIINIEAAGKYQSTTAYNSICGKTIYSICWQDKYIYVVCNDRIAIYEDNPNKKDGFLIPNIFNTSAISIRNNFLFVGTQNGHLCMYKRREHADAKPHFNYDLIKEFELAPRYITNIAWSPIATNRMAVAANANCLHIMDFYPDKNDLMIEHKIEMSSTKAANASVKWSNRSPNELLTCGYDGAIRVWNLLKDSKNMEDFVKLYHCPMRCGLFLPTDEHIVVCAGRSTSLEFIDMRLEDQSQKKTAKTKKGTTPKTLDTIAWASKALACNETKQFGNANDRKTKRSKAAAGEKKENNLNYLPNEEAAQNNVNGESSNNNCNSDEVINMLEKLKIEKALETSKESLPSSSSSLNSFMRKPTTLLYLTAKELNKEALNTMFEILTLAYNKKSENKSLCGKLYGTKMEAKLLLAEELKNHQNSETKGISGLFMPQLNSNLKEEILKCVQTKQLSEWHVSLAPCISYSFWQKCCQAFAEQLNEDGYALQAATYMLAIHKQAEAIEILTEKHFYKEAMLIARVYLQSDDPLVNTITEQWITYLCSQGNLTGAALLCLLSQQKNRAYECLVKIRNSSVEIERVIRLLKSADTSV